MHAYFTRERFGRPQFLAGLLLLAFLCQAVWLVGRDLSGNDSSAMPLIQEARTIAGWRQWHGDGIAGTPYPNLGEAAANELSSDRFDSERSPLLSLVSAAPLLAWPGRLWNSEISGYRRWLLRLPFLACGMFLGASLWYVARRLCGNAGGFVALTFYCFSPSFIQSSALWHTEPDLVTAWGAFGSIFTAIAVAHTLYAPREVVLWNWRRILLLGVAFAIAVGTQFSMIVVVPVALIFLLYVAPVRRLAGLAIWLTACAAGFVLLIAFYFFHWHIFAESMRHAVFWRVTWRGFAVPAVYKQAVLSIGRACPALAFLLPVTLATYALWPRSRYFGNTAPLLVGALFFVLGMAHPHEGGSGFLLAAIPFLFIFVAGLLADLMETSYRTLITACVIALLATYIVRTLFELLQVPKG